MPKLIVILGITGQQGSSIANHFLTLPQYTIRGITRNINSPSSLSLIKKGISLHEADLNDLSTLPSAFAGALTIFCTTDFWGPFYNPSTSSLNPKQSLGKTCQDIELQQVCNIFDAASKVEGLKRLVVSTLVDVETISRGKYKNVFHWDGKARGVAYGREVYGEFCNSVLDEVFVGNYMGNWRGGIRLLKDENEAWRLALVGSGQTPLPHLDVEADLGGIVAAMLESPPGKKVLAVGEMVSWSEMMRVWCEVNKVRFGGFKSVSVELFDRFFPIPGLGRELGEMMEFMEGFGYVGGDPDVMLPGELESPPKLTNWREYVEKQDWSSILNA